MRLRKIFALLDDSVPVFVDLYGGRGGGGQQCQRKQKKSIDQRALQIGYEGIKSLRSLDMKNYLVTEGLSSLVESHNCISLAK